jgi:transcriptional regulator with XRE-family HTH domain
MTQVELAQRSSLPQSHISRLEAGKHSPTQTTLEKLAQALDANLSDLEPSV